ncbi:uncharacterized protein BCR38DRAFT_359048 [Pseudomassariella vexata]|uniref:Rhodopsin domain-containing protein n=1 Tax=Pseudomassariella vexata TaxID=1141098 RepID=A0A1Y2EIY3_9PEZI|nr:uncharacterized protein BCR38DRAFT_359048 [Pseudomassariella vexata]ORY71531.1 hypothetical protein BCR38DRAFT_359048 [Pseudomassariella vexata]
MGWSRLYVDDYLMILAAFIYAAETYLAWSVDAHWYGIANNGMTDEERAAVIPGSHEEYLRIGGSKTQIAGQNSYTALLWTLKLSVCFFYLRLTQSLQGYEQRIKIGFAVICVTWIWTHLTLLAGCFPFGKYWQINPDPGNFCQAAISHLFIFTCVCLDVITDTYLMSIPLPMMWKAGISNGKKFGLCALFSGAFFVMAAAILRCVFLMENSKTGASQSGAWACRETFVSVIVSNLPPIWSSSRISWRRFNDTSSRRCKRHSGPSANSGQSSSKHTDASSQPKSRSSEPEKVPEV